MDRANPLWSRGSGPNRPTTPGPQRVSHSTFCRTHIIMANENAQLYVYILQLDLINTIIYLILYNMFTILLQFHFLVITYFYLHKCDVERTRTRLKRAAKQE